MLNGKVKQYFADNPDFEIIAITGSVGKTTTKNFVSKLLSDCHLDVVSTEKNTNTEVSVPLSIFGLEAPSNILSISEWKKIKEQIDDICSVKEVSKKYFVIELGVDRPGDMANFLSYLNVDYSIITEISPSHIENFKEVDDYYSEKWSLAINSSKTILNLDSAVIKNKLGYDKLTNYTGFGLDSKDGLNAVIYRKPDNLLSIELLEQNTPVFKVETKLTSHTQIMNLLPAIKIARELNLSDKLIKASIENLSASPGRGQLIKVRKGVSIIDESYNSSPMSLLAALDNLESFYTDNRKFAAIGSMNELGEQSKFFHEMVAKHILTLKTLDVIVFFSKEALDYMEPILRDMEGLQILKYSNASKAGVSLLKFLDSGDLMLIKGSQGGIYSEIIIEKLLPENSEIELVRQSDKWKAIKADLV